jgi:hypothetical protein
LLSLTVWFREILFSIKVKLAVVAIIEALGDTLVFYFLIILFDFFNTSYFANLVGLKLSSSFGD